MSLEELKDFDKLLNEYYDQVHTKLEQTGKLAKEAEELELEQNIKEFKQNGTYPADKCPENWQIDSLNPHIEINVAFDFARIFPLIGQKFNLDEPVTLDDTRMEAIAKSWHQKSRYRFSRVAFEHATQYEAKRHYVFNSQLTDYELSRFENCIHRMGKKKSWTLADEIENRKLNGTTFTLQEIFLVALGLIDLCWIWHDVQFRYFQLSPSEIELIEIKSLKDHPLSKQLKNIILDDKGGKMWDIKWIEPKTHKQNIDEVARNLLEWQHCEWKKPVSQILDPTIDKKWQNVMTWVGFILFEMMSFESFTYTSQEKAEVYFNQIVDRLEQRSKLADLILGLLHFSKEELFQSPHHAFWWMIENCFENRIVDESDFSAARSRRDKRQDDCYYKLAARRKAVTVITMHGLLPEQATYDFLDEMFSPFALKEDGGYTHFRIENYNSEIGSAMITFLGNDQQERAHLAAEKLIGFSETVVFFVEDNVRLPHDWI